MATVTEKNTLTEDLATVEQLAGSPPVCEAVIESVRTRATAELAWQQLVSFLATMAAALVILLVTFAFGGQLSGFVSFFVSDQSVFAAYGVVSSPTAKFFSWQEFAQIIVMAAPLLALYLLPLLSAMAFACCEVHIENKTVSRESQK